jgi:hypothetical protein
MSIEIRFRYTVGHEPDCGDAGFVAEYEPAYDRDMAIDRAEDLVESRGYASATIRVEPEIRRDGEMEWRGVA